ncbi:NHL repeat protein [Anopheles sinensis]|uniref:NHL repeat protein n=1 Tax=Anopheles sinensis TaxID=74873 RepID=A0A084WC04_ANOSI|nr:NHL repeat protein [Anopheles sinensis]
MARVGKTATQLRPSEPDPSLGKFSFSYAPAWSRNGAIRHSIPQSTTTTFSHSHTHCHRAIPEGEDPAGIRPMARSAHSNEISWRNLCCRRKYAAANQISLGLRICGLPWPRFPHRRLEYVASPGGPE